MPVVTDAMRYHEGLPPWQIQPDETHDQFAAFVKYRDSTRSKRSIPKVCEEMLSEEIPDWSLYSEEDKKKKADGREFTVRKWFNDNEWVARVRAYEAAMDAERTETRFASIRRTEAAVIESAAQRHAQIAQGISNLALMRLAVLHERAKSTKGASLDDMEYATILNWAAKGILMERDVLGMDTQAEIEKSEARINGTPRAGINIEEAKRMARAAVAALKAEEESIDVTIKPPEGMEDDANEAAQEGEQS